VGRGSIDEGGRIFIDYKCDKTSYLSARMRIQVVGHELIETGGIVNLLSVQRFMVPGPIREVA
jgi:hypothetical protein